MKNILIGTDLSARSDRAVERAVSLASELGAHLTIVHVVDDDLPVSLVSAQREVAKETIHNHIETLNSASTLDVSIEIVVGRVFHDVLEIAENVKAELIVLGVHREDTFREFMDIFSGTTAERIIRASEIPVLSVTNRVGGPYRRIMVGVDFSAYSRRAVEFAVDFAPDAVIHLVHAYDVPFKGFLYGRATHREVSKEEQLEFEQKVEAEMVTFLADHEAKAPKFVHILKEGEVRGVLRREARRLKTDLIIIGTHGRTGVAHAFLGSVADDMLREPPCDIVAVKAW